jgi:preprotein translocase subunit SecD
MRKLKQMARNWRIILLVVLLAISYLAIEPDFGKEGVAIRSISKNSSAAISGMRNPEPGDKPMLREVVTHVNGRKIGSEADYFDATKSLIPGDLVKISSESNFRWNGQKRSFSFFDVKHEYMLTAKPVYRITYLDEYENVTVQKTVPYNATVNGTTVTMNRTINVTELVQKADTAVIGTEDLGIRIYDAPTNNLKKGLDLQGGTRVLLKPETEVSQDDLDILIDNLRQRLNVYGLSDIVVTSVKDLAGQQFLLVEVAGANEDEVKDLISRQGKFEAKIGNSTVFRGGEDIRFVCRSAECSMAIDPRKPCGQIDGGLYQCSFQFSITLSPEAAQRQADLTKDLAVIEESGFDFLNTSIDLYLDNELVDSLRIGADLKGKAVTDISISGPGTGDTLQDAVTDSGRNMKKLQTVLVTGSLPVKLDIVKVDTVSPLLGQEFVNNAILVVLLSIVAVSIVVSIRYRSYKISIPIIITMIAEIVLILGMAAFIGWNIDLAAVAAILVAVGTGVDDQIVIADETLAKKRDTAISWKDKLKNAFFIIMSAYAVAVAAMIPLMFAGAGLLKGFAITTIFGVSIGVFVTRPAFAAMVEILTKD